MSDSDISFRPVTVGCYKIPVFFRYMLLIYIPPITLSRTKIHHWLYKITLLFPHHTYRDETQHWPLYRIIGGSLASEFV